MGWDSAEIEGDAAWLYKRAGLDTGAPAPPLWLATEILGPGSVVAVPSLRERGGACLVRVNGKPRVYYRASLPPVLRDFAIGHELGHWLLGDRIAGERDTEAACDYLAAALIAPRAAFLRAVQKHGARFTRLAKAFATTESLVALRYGECTGEPLALVAPRSVRVRGAAFEWPTEVEMRAEAPGPGLRKATLRDADSRVAVHVG